MSNNGIAREKSWLEVELLIQKFPSSEVKKKKKVSDVNRPGQDRGSQGVAGRSLSDVCFLSTSVGAADMAAGKQSPYSERACFCSVFSWGY